MNKQLLLLVLSLLPCCLEASVESVIKDFKELRFEEDGCCGQETERINLNNVISTTLKCQWDIKISTEIVQEQAGAAQRLWGAFDPVLDTVFNHIRNNQLQVLGFKSTRGGHINSLDVGISKLTCTGTLFNIGGTVLQQYNPLFLLFNPYNRTNQVSLFFTIDQPLLRNFLYNQDCIDAKTSCMELKALQWEMIQEISNRIRLSTQSYWDLIAAKQILEVRRDSYKWLKWLARGTEKLIEGNQLAASELDQQFAELFRARRARTMAEQDVYQAYNDLQLAVGLGVSDAQCMCKLNIPDLITEKFPSWEEIEENCLIDRLIEKAIQNRGDYLALRWRIVEAALQLKSANNALLPEFDLLLGSTLLNSDINDKARPFFRPFGDSRPQTDWRIGFSFSYPLCNDQAIGEYRERRAQLAQISLLEQELYQTIRTDIAIALRNYFSLKREMEDADLAVQWYQKTLEDSTKRFKEGYSSLFIVIDYQNRLNDVLIEKIITYTAFARNLVELYFLTGVLVRPNDDFYRVSVANVYSISDLVQQPCCFRYR